MILPPITLIQNVCDDHPYEIMNNHSWLNHHCFQHIHNTYQLLFIFVIPIQWLAIGNVFGTTLKQFDITWYNYKIQWDFTLKWRYQVPFLKAILCSKTSGPLGTRTSERYHKVALRAQKVLETFEEANRVHAFGKSHVLWMFVYLDPPSTFKIL